MPVSPSAFLAFFAVTIRTDTPEPLRLFYPSETVWLIYKRMKAEERYGGAVRYTGNGEWVPKFQGQPVYQAPPPTYGSMQ